MGKRYLAPSVKKAFDILEVISKSREGLALTEIAKSLKMAKSTAHGIVSILEEVGAVIRDPKTKKFGLGLTLFQLGHRAYSQIDLREIARPLLEELMEKVQETVFFGAYHGDNVTILDTVECGHDFKITSPIGTNIPFLSAAIGKAVLACMTEAQAERIIESKGLPKYTDKSIIDPAQFLEEIKKTKEKGYSTDYEEYMSGVRAVAAPIADGSQIAVVWVVGFTSSLNDKKMNDITLMILEVVNSIKQQLFELDTLKTSTN